MGVRAPRAPTYFAPEFAEGAAASPASDIYTLGLCLWEFLAGQPAYMTGGKSVSQAAMAILQQHNRKLPELRQHRQDVPEELLAILNKATARLPAERYATADEFAAALAPFAGHASGPSVELDPGMTVDEIQPVAVDVFQPDAAPTGTSKRAIGDESSVMALELPEVEEPPEPAQQTLHEPEIPPAPAPQTLHEPEIPPVTSPPRTQAPAPAPVPEIAPQLEITAPQPSVEARALDLQAASVNAPVKESAAVKLQYLFLGMLLTLFVVASTAATTAYLLRAVTPQQPLAPPPSNPAVAAAKPAAPQAASALPAPATPQRVEPPASESPAASEMVSIPAGVFRMGSREGYPDERPEHLEPMSAYSIDKLEVTVAQFEKCVQAGECRRQRSIHQEGAERKFDRFCNYGRKSREQHPMNCVDWYQARAYCRWAGKRLPTEAEWEYAARGGDGRKFPWGNEAPSESRLNACGGECVILGAQVGKGWQAMYEGDDGWDTTAPVGSFPGDRSPFGVLDLAGNVAEWTDTEYSKCYRDDCEPDSKERVLRGGAWNDDSPRDIRTSYRNRDVPHLRASFVGFRCAKSESSQPQGGR